MADGEMTAPVVVRRRRRWPWIVAGVIVLVVVLVLAAPSLFAGFAAKKVSSSFAADHRGRLEIGELELGWFSRQKVSDARLLDPAGAEVARASVDLPSLWQLATGGGKKIGVVKVVATADVVADDAGSTNLQRALEETEEAQKRASEPSKPGEPTDLGKLLRELDLDAEVRVTSLKWTDVRTRALGKPFELRDLVATVAAKPGQPIALAANGVLASEGNVPLKANAKVTDLFAGSELDPNARFELDADVASLPSGLIDALSGQDGLVASVMGEHVRVQARGSGTLTQGEIAVDVTGDKGRAQVACAVQNQVVRAAGESAFSLTSELDAERLQRWIAAKMPATVRVEVGRGLSVRVSELEAPIATPIQLDTLLASLRVRGEAKLDSVACTLTGEDGTAQRFELSGADATFQVAPDGGKTPATLTASAILKPSGRMTLTASADARALAKFAPGQTLEPLSVQLGVQTLDVAWVEGLAGKELGLAEKLGKTLDVDARTTLSMSNEGTAMFDVATDVKGERGGASLKSSGSVARAMELADELDKGTLPAASATFELDDRGLAQAFVPASVADDVRELVGAKLAGSLKCEPNGKAARLSCDVRAERLEANVAARVVERTLTVQGGDALKLVVRPSAALLARRAASSVPEGAKLAFADAEPRVELALTEAKVPLDAWMPAEGQQPAQLADVVRGTSAQVNLALPSIRYEQPPLAAGAKAVPIDVSELAVAATLAASKPAEVHATGRVAGAKGGQLKLDATCADPGAFLVEGAELPAIAIQGDVAGLPTALADAIAGQDGLLVDALGATVDVRLSGKLPGAAGEPLRAELKSPNAGLNLVASFEEKKLVAQGSQGLTATVPLTPLFSKRVVGNLVPLLVNASKPPEAKPVALQVSNFTLPLDGDLRQLDANVRLDLGEVVYDLLPGLNDALASFGVGKLAQQKFALEPIEIPIEKGVARYDRLPLSISGQQVVFKGSFDLATREMSLATDLPLKALGSGVARELDKVREYIDPNTLVPIEIKGSWNKPRVSLGKDFLENVVKKAGEDALKKGLFDLLDKQKRKD